MIADWLLPAEAYFSDEWFAREQHSIFAHNWIMVGTVDDLRSGDNLAPASVVADVAGRTIEIVAGEREPLVVTPVGARVEVWAGYLFVQLDPAAPGLGRWMAEFPNLVGAFQPETLVEVARHRFELDANWKFFVENHVDVYHLWYLHGDSLASYDHPRATWRTTGPHWVFYEPPRKVIDVDDPGFWRGLRPLPGIGKDRWGSGAHLLYPNLTLATGAGFFMTYQCSPISPDRSVVDMRVRAVPGAEATAMLTLSQQIIEDEDGSACEALQRGVRSPRWSVGPLAADHELPITAFQRSVLAACACEQIEQRTIAEPV